MKHFWKMAIMVFVLLIAVPMIAIGCGKKQEVDPDEGKERYIVTFACTEVASGEKDEQGEDIMMPIGRVSVVSKAIEVVEGSTITTNGNEITIGKAKVTATPIANDEKYTYSFVNWEAPMETVQSNMTIKANFKRELAVYTIKFDTNGKTINEEIPEDMQITYNDYFTSNLPVISTHGYTFAKSTKYSGWSIDAAATVIGDTIGNTQQFRNLESNYRAEFTWQPVSVTEFADGITYYTEKDENKIATKWEEGKTYFIKKYTHEDASINIDYVNHTMTLYAIWVENYVNVNVFKNVTKWKSSGRVEKSDGMLNSSDGSVKIALYSGGREVAKLDTTNGRAVVKNIDFVDENGQAIEYKIYAQASQYDETLIDLGKTFTVTYNGSFSTLNFDLSYCTVTLEHEDNIASVTGAGLYLAGQEATVSATAAPGYHFVQWNKDDALMSNNQTYTFTVSEKTVLSAVAAAD